MNMTLIIKLPFKDALIERFVPFGHVLQMKRFYERFGARVALMPVK